MDMNLIVCVIGKMWAYWENLYNENKTYKNGKGQQTLCVATDTK